MEKFQEYVKQNPIIVIIFIFMEILIIVLIIASAQSLSHNDFQTPNIPVSSFQQELDNMPNGSKEAIQSSIYSAIALNGGTISSIGDSDAKIREGTLINHYFQDINMNYISFIVDIPSIEQSYWVFHEWSSDNNNKKYMINQSTMVSCPVKQQIIYYNFDCEDKYNGRSQNIVAKEFFPEIKKESDDFTEFNAFVDSENSSRIIIDAIHQNPSESTKKSDLEKVKSAVESLGISPDLFEYYFLQPSDITFHNEY